MLGVCAQKESVFIVTELFQGGDLWQFLKSKNKVSPAQLVSFAMDICAGMGFIHVKWRGSSV
jgi:hypothetical protein